MKGILNMDNNDGYGWGIKGLISKNPQAISPCPRTINCYSINGRVVELPKITSLLRKIWTGFGGKKKPSCVFSFTLPNDRFDINLSPDKQQVLLSDEQEICQLLQEYVTRFYSNKVNGVFQAQPLQVLTEQEDENVGERSMHKQRFAFVHDLSKARMQHDLSGRESFDGIEKEAECPNNADTQQSVELEEGTEPISKKSRVATREMIGATTTSSLLHRESRVKKIYEFGKSGPSFRSQERISDLERRKWTEIQSKFHSNSDDIQNTLLRPEPERNTPDDLPHEKFTIKSLPSFSDDQRQGRDQRSATKIYMEQEVKNDDDRYDDEDSDREEEGADDDEEEDRHATRRRRLVNFENVRHQSLGQKSSHSQSQYEKSTSQEERVQKTRIVARQQNDDCRGEAGVEKVEALQESTDLSDDLESVEGDHHEIGDGDKTSTETGRGSTDKEDPSQEEDEETNHVVADQHPGPTDESFERITSEVSMKIRDVESAPSLVWKSFGSAEQISCNTRYERLQMYQRKKDQVLVHNSAKKDFPIEKGAEDITNSVGTQKSSDGNVVSLSKNEFRGGMQVLGQFNLGFILCRCEKNNLWILDQHGKIRKFKVESIMIHFIKLC
jgi:DNA mismatch repair ATPase MutL